MGSGRVCMVCQRALLGAGVIHLCLVGSGEHATSSPGVWLISQSQPRIVAVEPDESAPRSEGDFTVLQVRQIVQATSSAVFSAGPGLSLRTVQDEHQRQIIIIAPRATSS